MLQYIFKIDDGETFDFNVSEEDGKLSDSSEHFPAWLQLEHQQCSICPLTSKDTAYCPTAIAVYKIILTFSPHKSYDLVEVTVISPEREYYKKCDIQTGLNSLLGLVMANSACPILSKLKPMARYHLPFSNIKESLIRTLSFYLIEQLLVLKDQGKPDWQLEGLNNFYDDLKIINEAFLERVKGCASQNDANLNAIIRFFTLSTLIPITMEDFLEEVGHLYSNLYSGK